MEDINRELLTHRKKNTAEAFRPAVHRHKLKGRPLPRSRHFANYLWNYVAPAAPLLRFICLFIYLA